MSDQMTEADPAATATYTIEQALQFAIASHQAGDLTQAERLYRSILKSIPGHPDANHNLGVLAVQVGRPIEALPYLKLALESAPSKAQYWLSYAEALLQAGLPADAGNLLRTGRAHGLNGSQVDALEQRIGESKSEKVLEDLNRYTPEILSRMYDEGKFSELKLITAKLIDRSPDDAMPRKVLAAVFRKEGNLPGALEMMLSAVERAPGDAESHYNLGIIREELGQAKAAEASYRRAVALNPGMLEAQNNLGVNLHAQGRFEEAASLLKNALGHAPDSTDTYNNLGAALKELGRFSEAEECCAKVLQMDPDSPGAHNNLGNVLKASGRMQEAEDAYLKALKLRPDHAGTFNNLGNLLQDMGRLPEAEEAYRRGIACNPRFADAWNNLGNLLSYRDAVDDEMAAYAKALDLDPNNVGLSSAVFLAVRHYLASDYEKCRAMIAASAAIAGSEAAHHKTARAYREYLQRLLERRVPAEQARQHSDEKKRIYIAGDSHSLSLHELRLVYQGEDLQATVEWIPGCKQWHLANEAVNKYKQKFEQVMRRLPPASTVLLTLGEIDCRPNEGILAVHAKHPEKSIDSIVEHTTRRYIDYVAQIMRPLGHRVIVCGVPASNPSLASAFGEQFRALQQLIPLFNRVLGQQAERAGFDFLDMYRETAPADDRSEAEVHLDSFHLIPEVYASAFRRMAERAC
jgi:tetratricopeptide (TPR) repeat protein